MDPTVDPAAKSFVPVAPESHFPLQNLPYGVFSPTERDEPRVGVRIGDHVLDLAVIQNSGLLDSAGLPEGIFSYPVLNPFMELDREQHRVTRLLISPLLIILSSSFTVYINTQVIRYCVNNLCRGARHQVIQAG